MKRRWLLPAVPLFAAAVRARHHAYAQEILSVRRLHAPVVSVGALAAGGSGKTPMTLAVLEMLRRSGRFPVVLSRGYGRTSSEVLRVNPDGDADRFGDEPLMLARNGAEVWVGADRYTAGSAALTHYGQDNLAFVLDDGFQHRGTFRSADIVMLSACDLDDHLLPAGDLREPLSHLARADILAFDEEDAGSVVKFLDTFPRASCARPGIWIYRRVLDWPAAAQGKAVAFCGIARPERLFHAVDSHPGLTLSGKRAFPDHHRYSAREVDELVQNLRGSVADLFVTTEKDLARLPNGFLRKLESTAPVIAPKLSLLLDEPAFYLEQVEALLHHGARVA